MVLKEFGYPDADECGEGVAEERVARLAEWRANRVVFKDCGCALQLVSAIAYIDKKGKSGRTNDAISAGG
jgi:hypothetical protein